MIEDCLNRESVQEYSGVRDLFGLTEFSARLEQLENGVCLEHLNTRHGMESDDRTERMIGQPYEDMETWSPQAEDYSCAIACQEMIAEQLTGKDISEEKMIAFAKERGWYDSEGGTTVHDVGKLLEEMGMNVERQTGADIGDLAVALEQGKVICGVNNMLLSEPALAVLPGLRANHAVQVIGIDTTNPEHVEVILNDPGVENGCGIRHSLEDFQRAWKTSGNYMAAIEQPDDVKGM